MRDKPLDITLILTYWFLDKQTRCFEVNESNRCPEVQKEEPHAVVIRGDGQRPLYKIIIRLRASCPLGEVSRSHARAVYERRRDETRVRGARLRRLRARSLALASLNINGELARRLNNDILYASALILSGPPFLKSVATALILSIFK